MKKRLLALILLLCLLTGGCFSYKDINKLLIVVTTIIDIDEDNNINLYLEVFKPYRSEQTAGGKGQRLIYKSKGETVLEAIRDLNLGTSQKLNFTQNKSLIFTKRAAQKGLDYFIDFLNRDQEFVLRQFMYIIDEDPETFLNTKLNEEEYIGLYLYELPINQAAAAKRLVIRIDEYINNRFIGNQIDIIPVLIVSKEHLDSKVRLHSTAILKDDKYIGEMSFDETAVFNVMTGPIRTGTLLVHGEGDNIMTLEIVGSKVKTNLQYDGETVKVTKDIRIRTTFAETQKPLELLQPQVRSDIIAKEEENLQKKCEELFAHWKEQGTDIFKLTALFQRQYPQEELEEDLIKMADMKVNIRIFIEGSTDVTDYVD